MAHCSELALRLSENYHTTHIYNHSDESLSGYLAHNGILLTMCIMPTIFGGPCKIGGLSNHFSASWIRNIETGFRIFGGAELLPIGLILDPTTVDINCAYPIDAVTDTRLNSGCGFQPDAPEASNNYRRILERYEIVKYKNDMFGKDAKWSDIDCEDFLGNFDGGIFAMNDSDCSLSMEHDVLLLIESSAKITYKTWSNIVGHPVCNVTKAWVEPTFRSEERRVGKEC